MFGRQRSFPRESKIAATVRRFVAEIVRDNYSGLGITIVDAEARGNLSHVRIFYQGRQQDMEKVANGIRYELARKMNQKYVPELKFIYDDTIETSARIEKLLKSAL